MTRDSRCVRSFRSSVRTSAVGLFFRQLLKSFTKLFGEGAGLPMADGPAVHLGDADNFRRGAGQETLVGRVDVVTSQRTFHGWNAGGLGEFDHRIARHALEDSRVG